MKKKKEKKMEAGSASISVDADTGGCRTRERRFICVQNKREVESANASPLISGRRALKKSKHRSRLDRAFHENPSKKQNFKQLLPITICMWQPIFTIS